MAILFYHATAASEFLDFSDWTLVPPASDNFTNNGTEIIIDRAYRTDEDSIYKDFGDDHFSDFVLQLTVYATAQYSYGSVCVAGFYRDSENNYGLQNKQNSDDGFGLVLEGYTGASYRFKIIRFEPSNGESISVTIPQNTPSYLTFTKSGTATTLDIYSDEARQSLVQQRSLTVQSGSWRYMDIVGGRDASSGIGWIEGVIKDVKFISGG